MPITQSADSARLYKKPYTAIPQPSQWAVWASGHGGYGVTNGDASAGSHERTSSNYGFAMGASALVTPETEIGVAVGRGYTGYELSDGFGKGDIDTLQAAIYGRTQFEQAYVSASLGYAYHDVSTERTLTVAGLDRFAANFVGHGVTGELEGGYGMGWFTPYAAVRVSSFRAPSYSETTEAGQPTFALDYDAGTTIAARTELGVRIEQRLELEDGASLALVGGAAWAHAWGSDTEANASFQALPGARFTVVGAERSSDSLLVSAGAEVTLANGLSLGGSVGGEFAEDSRHVAGMARLTYRW
ncbi:autotransporter outer membrane beta-barrel domain-containing protein [Paracoccus liaowanqingii]|uniref:Autotransporter outer membrane beta-barrel domain-containing protein n=2 Tax=Paracoccus liaowanqingii TaxID=2560053 RepID=A0A4Z1BGY4_9RHOB|nr:autotransporter outer membrane beta-barrel domain-containing protein [Paracoccus liaowanqingii]